ncbi:hypothetical protein SESBI_47979 [Sesbania bispinosa]|nr:hypothetical protein SESBI_47979 [Sesbania bispinosa]
MDYSGYNHLQQQHSYNYDPSQIQPYDQSYSYQPYYPYNHQYAYYPPDTHQTHLQFQPELTPVHPPGVNPTAPEPVPPRPNHAPFSPPVKGVVVFVLIQFNHVLVIIVLKANVSVNVRVVFELCLTTVFTFARKWNGQQESL